MEMLLCKLFIFVIFWMNRTTVLCFNIEERDPIAKQAPIKDSYFGFSVAQHRTEGNSNDIKDNWILVGAPLGQNLQPNTNRSGALFKCPITENNPLDCIQIETDGRRYEFDYDDEEQKTDLLPPGNDEIKDLQWLGVTVKSQKPGGKVVVCAHRYIQSQNLDLHHYGMGLCHLLSNTLEVQETLQPCKGRPMEKLHQQYGFCQVGTSLAFLRNGYTLMGAPGPYTWRGTIFAKEVEGKDFVELDKTIYRGPLNDDPEPINKYSYLGMSVTGGHFFDKNHYTYVAGAPRSNLTGQVYFFERFHNVEEMNITKILNGQQFASSYGYEVLAADINTDGFDDLLVGAPFYYEGETHGGAVYIYTNLRNCREVCEYDILKGLPESRFGFSMTSLGDINKDGYNDVAIGAPYEFIDAESTGAIYIYLGSNQGLQKKPSQVIKKRRLRTLGYSLSGGLDMDNNGYPDLLVGAYEIDRAILYRTRPIIDISINIKSDELNNINVTKKGCKADPDNTLNTCFTFRSCFKINEIRTKSFKVRYQIHEVPKKMNRVWFRNPRFPDTRKPNNTQIIDVDSTKREYCQTETVYISEGVGDILSPLTFLVNYSLEHNEINSPILNKTSIKEFKATFQKSCGDDDECESFLVLDIGSKLERDEDGYILDLGQNNEFILDVNVENRGESAYETKMFIMHPKALSYIALLNKNKTSHIHCNYENDTLVICNLGNPFQANRSINARLRFEIKNTKELKVRLTVFVNSTSIELSNQTKQSIDVILRKVADFTLEGYSKPTHFFYAGELKGQPIVEHFEDIGDRIIHQYILSNNGRSQLSEINLIIYWPYQINVASSNEQWLLYLESIPKIDGKTNCIVNPPDIINPLRLNATNLIMDEAENFTMVSFMADPEHLRSKRATKTKIDDEVFSGPDGKNRKVVKMNCLKNTAKCAEIICNIKQLNKDDQVVVNIFSRIWNSTLSKDYNKVDWVNISSLGRVEFTDKTVMLSNNSSPKAGANTLGYPGIVLADASLNIWIIVGSVIAGILVLIILSLILYKLGFFKRNRIKDQTLSGNLQKQGESESLLKVNEGKT